MLFIKYASLLCVMVLTIACSSSSSDNVINTEPPNTEEQSPANLQAEERQNMSYGESDTLVPVSQANVINAALENHNIIHNLTIYNGGHANWNFASYLDLQMKLVAFIKTHL